MNKYNFKNVRRLQSRIDREILDFKNSEIENSIDNTIIPKLFENLYELDEPAWEDMISKHKEVLINN